MTIVMESVHPRHCVQVDGVQERAVNVEDDGLGRGFLTEHAMRKRPTLKRCARLA
jgi:hypothetical protein